MRDVHFLRATAFFARTPGPTSGIAFIGRPFLRAHGQAFPVQRVKAGGDDHHGTDPGPQIRQVAENQKTVERAPDQQAVLHRGHHHRLSCIERHDDQYFAKGRKHRYRDQQADLERPSPTLSLFAQGRPAFQPDEAGEKEPAEIKFSFAPKVQFEGGKAVKAQLNWGKIEAPTLIKTAMWTATATDNTFNVLQSTIVEDINDFVSNKCDEVKDEWSK